MSAIVTDKIKKQFLLDLFNDFDSTGVRYYAGIGRSEQWDASDNPVTPQPRVRDERDARMNMQSMKNITDRSFVVPRSNWTSGAIYNHYDDDTIGYPLNQFYVMNSNQEIYICVQQGRDANGSAVVSTEQPTGNTNGQPFETSDGYRWKFIFSIGALRASKFLSSSYMPVQLVDSDEAASVDATAEVVEQRAVQLAARPGEVVGIEVTDQGSGYTSTPTVEVIGDGTGCVLVPIISGNALVDVRVKGDSDRNLNGTLPSSYASLAADKRSFRGSGYKRASVAITGGGGTGAKARVILGPEKGLGADPRDDLKTGACMFNAKIDGTENGDFLIGDNTFRQVILVRNPLVRDSANREDTHFFADATGSTLDRIELSGAGTFTEDTTITSQTGALPRATAYVDAIDSVDAVNNEVRLLVHQTEDTQFRAFADGDVVENPSGVQGTIKSNGFLRGEIDPHSGELLYIDNRAAVDRSAEQTEDLKIVIQL
jgi:hypothetical protein